VRSSLLLLLLALALAGCDPFHTGFEEYEPAALYRTSRTPSPSAAPDRPLRVMTWNIKFGGGRIDFFWDCFGDRTLMKEREVLANLEALAERIRREDPDLVLLQEIDVGSKRAAYVDQVQWLLDHTSLEHGAYASQWKADYIPSDGLGRMDSGIAVLSRWPFLAATRIALPEVSTQSALKRYFYLKRAILRTRIGVPRPAGGSRELHVVNVHTEAYSTDGTKQKHIDRFLEELAAIDAAGGALIGGGDLNAIPPGSQKQHDFPDSVCTDPEFIADDYRPEARWLDGLYARFRSAIPLADYQASNAPYFSHTVDKSGFWNRTLDYLFTNLALIAGSGRVHQDTMAISDHAPLTVELVLP
jgi:endonuclease/exonuclease/phosphatase family metal-dependent hydrolase